MEYFVYIAQCSDNSLYTGIATDVKRRIAEHNSSDKAAKYTRARQPITLVYVEKCTSKSDALKREYAIKKLPRSAKLALL